MEKIFPLYMFVSYQYFGNFLPKFLKLNMEPVKTDSKNI